MLHWDDLRDVLTLFSCVEQNFKPFEDSEVIFIGERAGTQDSGFAHQFFQGFKHAGKLSDLMELQLQVENAMGCICLFEECACEPCCLATGYLGSNCAKREEG